MTALSARGEWRNYWTVPIAAGLGYATSVIHIYGLGPYIGPISETFGWSRTQVTVGMTISTLIQGVFAVPIGLAVDKFGPRLLGIFGILFSTAAFACIGTASGTFANWVALWLLMAAATLPIQATVWTSAVASRFTVSRGMAFAVTMCGASIAQAFFPWLAATLITKYGWQTAFAYQGAIWFAIAFPIILFFFRGARDGGKKAMPVAEYTGMTFLEGIKSTIYLRLFLTSLMLTFAMVALSIHFVPILTARGASATDAAGIASLIGLASIVGRLGTGVLIDRYRANYVGAFVFLLPAIGAYVLNISGAGGAGPMLAAAFIGFTLGAELDVIVYILTRYFGLKNFGALFGAILVALSLGTALGPLAAARVFDVTGNYSPFLWATVALMLASSAALFSLPKPPEVESKLAD